MIAFALAQLKSSQEKRNNARLVDMSGHHFPVVEGNPGSLILLADFVSFFGGHEGRLCIHSKYMVEGLH